jgi:hypothetical protein
VSLCDPGMSSVIDVDADTEVATIDAPEIEV